MSVPYDVVVEDDPPDAVDPEGEDAMVRVLCCVVEAK